MANLDFPARPISEKERLREEQRQYEWRMSRARQAIEAAQPHLENARQIIGNTDEELKNKALCFMAAAKIFKDKDLVVDACFHYEQAEGSLKKRQILDKKTTIDCHEKLISYLQIMRDNDLNGGIYSNDRIIAILVEIENLKGNLIGDPKEINDCYKELSKYSTYHRSMQEIDNALTAAELGLRHNVLDAQSLYFCLQNAKKHCDIQIIF